MTLLNSNTHSNNTHDTTWWSTHQFLDVHVSWHPVSGSFVSPLSRVCHVFAVPHFDLFDTRVYKRGWGSTIASR